MRERDRMGFKAILWDDADTCTHYWTGLAANVPNDQRHGEAAFTAMSYEDQ